LVGGSNPPGPTNLSRDTSKAYGDSASAAEGREGGEAEELTSGLVRQAVKLVVEQLLEAEVREVLGRQRYARRPPEPPADRSSAAERQHGAWAGYRNGHKPRQFRTAEGKVPIDLPQVRDAPNHEMGRQRAAALVEHLRHLDLPSAAACLEDDLEASLAHLKLPGRHRRSVRTTNLCERSFALWRASERWRKVKFTRL